MSVNLAEAPDSATKLIDGGPMTLGDGVVFMPFGERYGLFHEGRQELVELNETAGGIWQGLARGEPPIVIAQALIQKGAPPSDAASYVEEALERWLGGGWMVPTEVLKVPDAAPSARLTLSILDVGFEVAFFGEPPPGVLDMLLPLRDGGGDVGRRSLRVSAWRDRYGLFAGGASRGLYRSEELAPALKAALTDQLIVSVGEGFVAHGGLVEARRRRVFLSGAPGAGKSTLTLALGAAGFERLSDDIVHVDARGWMRGAPFAPAMKPGAWPLLAGLLPDLESLPIHRRADGQDVRYATDVISASESRPLDIFIALARRTEGPVALEPMSGLEAMEQVLKDGFASAGRVSACTLRDLAEIFAAARCYTLRYADLSGAVDRLLRLVDE